MRALLPVLLLSVACTRAPDDTPAPASTPPSVAPKDKALFDQLVKPLPTEPTQRETACLARIVQARVLERRTDDPRAAARIRNARVECRGWLLDLWVDRAAQAATPEARAAACKSVAAHFRSLEKADGSEAAKRRAPVTRHCAP